MALFDLSRNGLTYWLYAFRMPLDQAGSISLSTCHPTNLFESTPVQTIIQSFIDHAPLEQATLRFYELGNLEG